MKILLFFICLVISGLSFSYELKDYSKDLKSMTAEERQQFFSSADKLKCPTCTGLSVLGSDATFSMQIRKKVVELVKNKKDPQAIEEFFVKRYGEWILRTPPKKRLSLVYLVDSFKHAGFTFYVFTFLHLQEEKKAKLLNKRQVTTERGNVFKSIRFL